MHIYKQFLASKLQNYIFSIYISYLLNIQAVYQHQVTNKIIFYLLLSAFIFFLLQVTHSFFSKLSKLLPSIF